MKLKNVNMDLLDSDYQTIRITVDKNYAACNVLANENNFKKDYLFTESISHDLNNKDWLEQIMLIVDKFINDGRLDYLENNQELGKKKYILIGRRDGKRLYINYNERLANVYHLIMFKLVDDLNKKMIEYLNNIKYYDLVLEDNQEVIGIYYDEIKNSIIIRFNKNNKMFSKMVISNLAKYTKEDEFVFSNGSLFDDMIMLEETIIINREKEKEVARQLKMEEIG